MYFMERRGLNMYEVYTFWVNFVDKVYPNYSYVRGKILKLWPASFRMHFCSTSGTRHRHTYAAVLFSWNGYVSGPAPEWEAMQSKGFLGRSQYQEGPTIES
jgi:hypothetical protein